MSTDHPTEPLPDASAVWTLQSDPEPRRRRRAWPWIVALVVVIALTVIAWFAGEAIARKLVTDSIRDQVRTQLSLPAEHPVDVQVEGAVLPQLIGGTLDEVSIASDDVTLGALNGDISIRAEGIPVRGDGPAKQAAATVTMDTAQLRTLMATVDGFPVDSVDLESPDITVSTEVQFFGLAFPIGISFTPSASDGDLVLTPASLTLAGAQVGADDLRDRFGGIADVVTQDWHVCIAQYVPAGVHLAEVSVTDGHLVADLDIDGAIISDPALQQNGTCD